MNIWNNFEIDCFNYLNKSYNQLANFLYKGGYNSNEPDILVLKKNGESFSIETKCCPAQCGQFVLFPDEENNRFIYSTLNATPLNQYSIKIIDFMNKNFAFFCQAGTKGKKILMEHSDIVFSNWIINHYKMKNTKFFITNNFKIIPIEMFAENFNIQATYRVKKSGSSPIGIKNIILLKETNILKKYNIKNLRIDNNKLFVSSSKDLNKTIFTLNYNTYMFAKRNNEFEIRKLSNTYNANVIFSISLKDNNKNYTDSFLDALI